MNQPRTNYRTDIATVKRTPTMISIGGPSCSGKTTLARRLVEHWGADRASLISLDRYYNDLSEMAPADRARVNFDDPESLDSELLVAQVEQLAKGEAVALPTYDFATHCRGAGNEWLEPRDFVIVEGLYAHYWSPLCDVVDIRLYLEVDAEIALDRRIDRDVRERGRTAASVRTQWTESVSPMQSRYVEPTRVRADLTISSSKTIEEMKQTFLSHFREELQR